MINLFKRLFKINRHFMICYFGSNDQQAQVTGYIVIETNNGQFFNGNDTIELIKNHAELTSCSFTGFNEISKRDFKKFKSKSKS